MKLLESPPSGEELKEIRLAYRLTPKEMGEVLGVSAQTVRSYEAGKTRIPRKHLKRINRLLSEPVPPAPPSPLSPEELRILRTTRGLTQRQVAEAFDVTVTSISNYEKGYYSIPAGLEECIKGLAEPKTAALPVIADSCHPTRQMLEEYIRSRAEECEQWLSLAQEMNPAQLREFRLSRGMSEKELANIAGISPSALFLYESGKRPIPKGLAQKIVVVAPDAVISPSELRELRLSLGLSQAELADSLGLTHAAITHYEAGTRKITHTLSEKILDCFRNEAKLELTCEEMKALRISMNLSQKDFGKLLDLTQVAEAQYENGNRKIPREVRRKILAIKTTESE